MSGKSKEKRLRYSPAVHGGPWGGFTDSLWQEGWIHTQGRKIRKYIKMSEDYCLFD